MSLDQLLDTLPNFAKDIKLNFSSLVSNHADLTEQQFWGTVLASAIASRNKILLDAIKAQANTHLSAEAIEAANAAATLMAMNNIYYRFVHLVSDKQYATMPAGLRMNMMREVQVDKMDFELWSLAVSAINGCGMCIDAHEKQLVKHEVKREAIQLTVRIASIVHALAVTLESV